MKRRAMAAVLLCGLVPGAAGAQTPAPDWKAPDSVSFERLVSSPLGDGRTFAGELLSIFLTLNVLLCAFNLIPLPPLDGASIIGLFVPEGLALKVRELSHSPMFQLAGLLVAWRLFPLIVRPLFALVLKAVHPGVGYS